MSWIHDLPIRRKLTVAFALVSGGALLITSIILVAMDLQQLRRDAADQLTAEAKLIGENSGAAIAFRDKDAATETLNTLNAIADVTYAVLYDDKGDVFARYVRNSQDKHINDLELTETSPYFNQGHLSVIHYIVLDGKRIGSLKLHSDLQTRYASLRFDALVTLGIAALVFAVALLLAVRLQRLISIPILSLYRLAQRVSSQGDYSLRAEVENRDEIGQLAEGVNDMLETVQHRDRELETHRHQLETEVAARTAELKRSNERLTTELAERNRTEVQLTRANADLERHRQETETLSEMNDRLQVCRDMGELAPVLEFYGKRLFPETLGGIHVFDESRSRLEPLANWGCDGPQPNYAQDDCWALRRGQAHIVPGPDEGLICAHVGDALPAGGYSCVPMLAQGSVIGVLYLGFPRAATEGSVSAIESTTPLAMTAAERIGLAIASLQLREKLREQSVRDPLTGLYNRRYMDESLERELARSARSDAPLTVVMLDLDYFKRFNDAHGHDAGDELLRELGKLLLVSVRTEDIACRYGGEEFILILSHANSDSARSRMEELRIRVGEIDVYYQGRSLGGVTVSIGIATFPEHGETPDALVKAADDALYAAKEAGRNSTCVYAATRGKADTKPAKAKGTQVRSRRGKQEQSVEKP